MNKFLSFLFVALLFAPSLISARHIRRKPTRTFMQSANQLLVDNNGIHSHLVAAAKPDRYMQRRAGKRKGTDTVQIAGSSLPDCTHACGSCSPCRLVMVSFVCASLAEAETCPMAYKCMCNRKSYPVP